MKLRNKKLNKVPQLYTKKDCSNYYVRITTVEGKRKEINLGTSDKKEARIRAKREVGFLNGQIEGTFAMVADLNQIVNEYYSSKVNMQPSSLIRSKQHLKFFILYMKRHHKDVRHLNHVGVHHVSGFQSNRLKNTSTRGGLVSPKTVRESMYVVNNLFEWAIKRNYVMNNPVKKMEIVTAPSFRQHVFSEEALLKILSYCKDSPRYGFLYPAFLTLATTGMRSGELAHLTWDDINFERTSIQIRTKTLPNGQEWTTKSQKNRELKMDNEVHRVLTNLKAKAKGEWVFSNSKGRRQTGYMLWSNLRVICDQLDIPRGQVHSFRRSFACMMDKAVNDRVVIKETLGHATMTMTDRYCGYRPKEYVDKAHLKTTAEFIKKLKEVEKLAK